MKIPFCTHCQLYALGTRQLLNFAYRDEPSLYRHAHNRSASTFQLLLTPLSNSFGLERTRGRLRPP